MKKTILIILPLFLIVGCSKSVESHRLVEKDGLVYLPNEKSPYTGEVSYKYPNDNVGLKGTYLHGLKSGLWQEWYDNGKIKEESNYSKGKYSNDSYELYSDGSKKLEVVFETDGSYSVTKYYIVENEPSNEISSIEIYKSSGRLLAKREYHNNGSTIYEPDEDGNLRVSAQYNKDGVMVLNKLCTQEDAYNFAYNRVSINGKVFQLSLNSNNECTYEFGGSFYSNRDGFLYVVVITINWEGSWSVLDTKIFKAS